MRCGAKAKRFTATFLDDGFTVFTLKNKARGASGQNRYHGIVVADGKRLDEALLEAGLARAYGVPAEWPDNGRTETRDYERRLR